MNAGCMGRITIAGVQYRTLTQRLRALLAILVMVALTACSSADLSDAATLVAQAATAVASVTLEATAKPTTTTRPTASPVSAARATSTVAPSSMPTPDTAQQPSTTPRPSATPLPRTIDGFRVVSSASLPREARQTLALIDSGGPFPYRQDDATFQNRERILPRKPAGYYREYTVVTPGSRDRGARRIVTGDQGEIYYTADHYNSFVRVIR